MSTAHDAQIKQLAERLPVRVRQAFVDTFTPTSHGFIDERERIEFAAYAAAPGPRLLLLTSTHLYLSRGPSDVETRARGSITRARAHGRDLVIQAVVEERYGGLVPETAAADIARSLSKPARKAPPDPDAVPDLRTMQW